MMVSNRIKSSRMKYNLSLSILIRKIYIYCDVLYVYIYMNFRVLEKNIYKSIVNSWSMLYETFYILILLVKKIISL